jgi:hypothetical protein
VARIEARSRRRWHFARIAQINTRCLTSAVRRGALTRQQLVQGRVVPVFRQPKDARGGCAMLPCTVRTRRCPRGVWR